ncbi:Polyol transporter 5 [Linum grandiflorum]
MACTTNTPLSALNHTPHTNYTTPQISLNPSMEPARARLHRFPIYAAVVASSTFFLLGFDVAILTGQLMVERSFQTDYVGNFESIFKVFISISALLAGPLLNYWGRKYVLSAGTILYTVGIVVLLLSINNFIAYKVGRAFMEIGIGIGLVSGPIYISEISAADYRGFLGIFPQVAKY